MFHLAIKTPIVRVDWAGQRWECLAALLQ